MVLFQIQESKRLDLQTLHEGKTVKASEYHRSTGKGTGYYETQYITAHKRSDSYLHYWDDTQDVLQSYILCSNMGSVVTIWMFARMMIHKFGLANKI